MALDHVKHVEVVALLRTISEQPAFRALPVELQQTAEGWLEENHPPREAYSGAMHAMAGHDPKPMRVTCMAAMKCGDCGDVVVTLSTGIEDERRDWPFELGGTDVSALGWTLRSLSPHAEKDTDRMRLDRDALTQALAILEGEPAPGANCGCANDCRYASRTGRLPDGVICRDGRR